MTQVHHVGTHHGVAIEVAAWDGVAATVDLSCACMFTREAHGATLGGGMAHLDRALGGTLQRLRHEGLFAARRGESLFIGAPPAGIAAGAVLVVGLGAPEDWSPDVMDSAVRQILNAVSLRPVRSVALAASMLDGGLTPAQTAGAANAMVRGLTQGLDAAARLRDLGLAAPLSLERWVFDVGIDRFDAAAQQFRTALTTPSPRHDIAAYPIITKDIP